MSYADYLSKWSYYHMLGRNQYLGQFKRLESGLDGEVYAFQLASLKHAIGYKGKAEVL